MADQAQFTEVYHRHSVPVFRFALHMSGSASTAEEVTQETFVAYFRHPGAFDEKRGTLSAYLYGIARHMVHRHLTYDRRFSQVDEDADDETFAAEGDLLNDLTRSENILAVQEGVLSLPEKYREVVVLCDLQELSYQTAAAILGCAVGTVRSRLHRGRGLLIAKLQARCAV